jgi:hypothetical protein
MMGANPEAHPSEKRVGVNLGAGAHVTRAH